MLKSLLKSAFKLLYRVEVRDAHLLQQHDRTVVIANHESLLDGVLLALFLPYQATFVVHEEVARHWLYRHLLKLVPHEAVSPTNSFAMRRVIKLVEQGTPVVIFPEGRITTSGALMKIYGGSANVAARTGATVVCVWIDGARLTMFSRLKGVYPRKLFPKLSLTVQPPCKIEAPAEGSVAERRSAAADAMMRIMQEAAVNSRPRQTFFQALLRARSVFGGGYRVLSDRDQLEGKVKKPYTYNRIVMKVLGVGRLMQRMTQPGEYVGLIMPTMGVTMQLVIGLTAIGRVAVMLNQTSGSRGIRSACHTAQIRNIITSRAYLDQAKMWHLIEGLDGVQVHFAEDLPALINLVDHLWVAKSMLRPENAFPVPQREPQAEGSVHPWDAPAVVMFTSGTETFPKGVVHSHDSILANVAQMRAVADFRPQDRFLACLPLFHCFGFTCSTMLPLMSGYQVVMFPSPLQVRGVVETGYIQSCTVLLSANKFLAQYGRVAHAYDMSSVRLVIAGGEKVTDNVRALWFERFGKRIHEGYGVTEMGPVVAVNTNMSYMTGSVGPALPCTRTEIEPVPGVERGGQLLLSGPQMMLGYLKHEKPGVIQPPSHNGRPGIYCTGDVVYITLKNFIVIVDRLGRMCKIGAEMVSLAAVEFLANSASPNCMHAVVNVPHPTKGEALIAYTTDPQLTVRALQECAQELGIPELWVPRVVVHEREMPMLGIKTDYVKLKAMALAMTEKAQPDEELDLAT